MEIKEKKIKNIGIFSDGKSCCSIINKWKQKNLHTFSKEDIPKSMEGEEWKLLAGNISYYKDIKKSPSSVIFFDYEGNESDFKINILKTLDYARNIDCLFVFSCNFLCDKEISKCFDTIFIPDGYGFEYPELKSSGSMEFLSWIEKSWSCSFCTGFKKCALFESK